MANNKAGQITFGVGFNVDTSGLNQIRSALQQLQVASTKDLVNVDASKARATLTQIETTASQVETALTKAFNPKLNSINVTKFNQLLEKTGLDLNTVYQQFSKLGSQGQTAFTQLAAGLLTTNVRLKLSKSLIDKMGLTLVNTIKWNIASTAINGFTRGIQSAYNYVKVLDSSLTDIRIVTGDSRELMDAFAKSANEAASALGRQTKDYTNAALTFYQQGLSDDQVAARTQATLKASNITGADVSDMADDLTAVWNGFQIGSLDAELAVSKLAAVADTSASNMSELATAMSKSASVANNMGVTIDQLAAQIATITQITRQAPETTGNALKTIYARINDIKAGTDDAEISLGNYTGKMAELGINVLDSNNELRDTGDVMTLIGEKWGSMSREQQIYLAQTMAGQRQMNNLIALFDNWDVYTKELNTSLDANNELNEKNDIYMQSLTAHLNQLSTANEGLIQSLSDTESFKGLIDAGTAILEIFTKISDSIGGGGNAIALLVTSLGQLFSKQIASEINSVVVNIQNALSNAQQLENIVEKTKDFAAINNIHDNTAVTAMVAAQQKISQYYSVMSQLQINAYNENVKNLGLKQQELDNLHAQTEAATQLYQVLTGNSNATFANLNEETAEADLFRDKINELSDALTATSDQFVDLDVKKSAFFSDLNKGQGMGLLHSFKEFKTEVNDIAQAFQNAGAQVPKSFADLQQLLNSFTGNASGQTAIRQNADAIRAAYNAAKQEVLSLSNTINTLNNNANLQAQTTTLETEVKSIQASLTEMQNSAAQAFNVRAITQTTFALGQLASITSSLGSSFSSGDFSKIFTSLLTTAPMAAMAIAKVTTNLSAWSLAAKTATIREKLQATVTTYNTLVKQLNANATKLGWTEKQKDAAITALDTQKTNALTAAEKELAIAKKATNVVFGIAATAIMIGVAAYQAYTQHVHEANLALIQQQNSLIELEKTKQQEAASNRDLAESYLETYQAYKDGTASKEDMDTAAQTLSDTLDKEALTVANLTGNYDLLTEAIQRNNEASLQQSNASVDREERQLKIKSEATLEEAGMDQASVFNTIGTSGYKGGFEQIYSNSEVSAAVRQYLPTYTDDMTAEIGIGVKDFDPLTIAELYHGYEQIVDSLSDEALQSQDIEVLNNWMSGLEETAKQYEQLQETKRSNTIALLAGQFYTDQIETAEDLEKALNDFVAELQKDLNFKNVEPDEIRLMVLEAVPSKLQSAFLAKSLIDSIVEQLPNSVKDYAKKRLGELSEDDLKIAATLDFSNGKTDALFDALLEKIKVQATETTDDILTSSVENVTELVKKAHDEIQLNSKSGSSKIKQGKDYTKSDTETIQGLSDSLSLEQIEALGGEERLAILQDENASLKEQLLLLNDISEIQAQLNLSSAQNARLHITADIQQQKDEFEAEIQKYQEERDRLQEQLSNGLGGADDLLYSQLQEQVDRDNELIDQLKEKLQEIADGDYTILLKADIEDSLLSYFQDEVAQTTNDAYLLAQAASLIGENFQVAANDISSLTDIFPQITQNAQALADGTIQLDQAVVQQVLGGQAQILQADTETTNQQLQNQVSILQAEIAYCDRKILIYNDLLAGKITESEAEDQLNQASADYSEKMSNASASTFIENQNKGVEANATAVNAFIKNIDQAGLAAAELSQVTANALAGIATTYQGGHSATGGGTTNFTLSTNVSDYAKNNGLDQNTAKLHIQAIQDEIDQLQTERDSAQDLVNNYLDLIAKNTANTSEAVQKADYAQKGLGGAYNPEQSSGSKSSGSKDNLKDADEITKDLIKDTDTVADIYEKQADTLDRQIDNLDRIIDRIDKNREKSIRAGKSGTIDQEIAALEQQKGLYEQKIDLLYKQADAQAANIQLMASELGLGEVQIDEYGNILNYQLLAIQYQTLYNNLLMQAAAATTKEAQDTLLNQAKIAKERWLSLQSSISQMQSYADAADEARAQIEDIADKEEELRIEQFKIQIDTDLDIADAKRDWNEFKKTVIDKIKDDDFVGQAKARLQDFYSYYDSAGNGIIQQLTDHVNKTRAELLKVENGDYSGVYGKNEAQALEDLKTYTDELMQNLEDVQEIAKDIHDYLLDEIDKAQDAFDDQIDAYEQVHDVIEHDMNLIELLHGEDDYDDLENYYDKLNQNYNKLIEFYRMQSDMWKQQMDNAELGTEEWEKFRDNWMSSISDMNDAVEDAVQNLLDQYNNTISKIIRDAKNQLMGGDWQRALDEWDKASWTDDRYLDMASRATGVLDFADSVNKAMEGQSPKVQKQLNDFLQSEIDDLNSITNLRQIDLDIASKKLEVLQKQIALEDVQNAKTNMRLRRDSQGNYTYQYTADEDATADAQTSLRDSIEELRLLAKLDVSDTIDEVQDKLEEFFEKAQELSETYYDDQEELQLRLLELQDEYFGEEGYITMLGLDYNNMQTELINLTGVEFGNLLTLMGTELQAFLGLNGEDLNDMSVWASIQALMGEGGAIPTLFDAFINDTYLKNFQLMSDENQKLLFDTSTGLNPSWNTAIGNMAQDFYGMTGEVVIPCMQAMVDANGVYIQSLAAVQLAAGIVFSDVVSGLDATIGYTEALIQDNGTLVSSFNSEINAVNSVYAAIQGLCSQYAYAEQAAIDAANAALKYWAAVQGNVIGDVYSGGAHNYGGGTVTPTPITKTDDHSDDNTGGGGGGTTGGGTIKKTTPTPKVTYTLVDDPYGVSGTKAIQRNTTDPTTGETTHTYVTIAGDNSDDLAKAKKKYGLASGGYTGEWVNGSDESNGRLAFLHQKELVLNKDDTSNVLSAVKVASGIVSAVAGIGSNPLGNFAANQISKLFNNGSESLQQNVKIEANFPNVESSQEIEKAFNNLVNAASQRANVNRRKY